MSKILTLEKFHKNRKIIGNTVEFCPLHEVAKKHNPKAQQKGAKRT